MLASSSILRTLDVQAVRADFPILSQSVNGKPLAFLDSAASSQKPLAVIEAMNEYYRTTHANVHRGVYTLSERATDLGDKSLTPFSQQPHELRAPVH